MAAIKRLWAAWRMSYPAEPELRPPIEPPGARGPADLTAAPPKSRIAVVVSPSSRFKLQSSRAG